MAGTIELVVPGDAAYLELIGQFVTFISLRMGFPEREVARIRLAVDEAASNVVLHAGSATDENFRVICEQEPDCLTVRVQDSGPMFDLNSVPDPDIEGPVEKRQVGGLGVYLMRQVMDTVELRPLENGKEVVLVKRLRGAEGATDGA